MVAGVDDQDIAFLHIGFLHDHFGGEDAVIRDHVGDIHDHTRTAQVGQGNIGDGAPAGMESPFTHQVGADRVAPVQDLTVRALSAAISAGDAFEEVHFQGFFTRPGGSEDTAILGQVVHFGFAHHLNKGSRSIQSS